MDDGPKAARELNIVERTDDRLSQLHETIGELAQSSCDLSDVLFGRDVLSDEPADKEPEKRAEPEGFLATTLATLDAMHERLEVIRRRVEKMGNLTTNHNRVVEKG